MKANTELNSNEFTVVNFLKRAIVDTHNGDYHSAEMSARAALQWLSSMNYRPVRVTNEDQWS